MNTKIVSFLILFLFLAHTSLAQKLPEKVHTTFKKLYPKPGSKSYSLYTDFYEIGYHDAQGTGDFINVIIDINGKHIGTITETPISKEKETDLIKKLGLDCDSPILKIVQTPEEGQIYYAHCYYVYKKGEKRITTLANMYGDIFRKGTNEYDY